MYICPVKSRIQSRRVADDRYNVHILSTPTPTRYQNAEAWLKIGMLESNLDPNWIGNPSEVYGDVETMENEWLISWCLKYSGLGYVCDIRAFVHACVYVKVVVAMTVMTMIAMILSTSPIIDAKVIPCRMYGWTVGIPSLFRRHWTWAIPRIPDVQPLKERISADYATESRGLRARDEGYAQLESRSKSMLRESRGWRRGGRGPNLTGLLFQTLFSWRCA